MLGCLALFVIATLTISRSSEMSSADENSTISDVGNSLEPADLIHDEPTRSFKIDYENDTFLMDGEPFRFISGSLHYFRIPHQYWRDRLRKIKLLGLNTIATYVEWSTHEPRKGEYNFEGDADFVNFVKLAEEEGLFVIARVGPYICAEREFGGYPAWLLTENPLMRFRTLDPTHMIFVDMWFQELFKHLKPLLYGNGGPIIMVQVENEYGAYPEIDKNYLIWLRDQIQSCVGDKAVLFTTDQTNQKSLESGSIPGVFSTVDFDSKMAGTPMTTVFENLRAIQPHGPLVNSELYSGWLSYWGERMQTVSTRRVIKAAMKLLAANVSFNFYMVCGGTNFGFTSGSGSRDGIQKLSLTSYDYDAPISEAGDLTDKYMAIRRLLRLFGYGFGTDEDVEQLKYSPKGDYGSVELSPKISLLGSPIGKATNKTTYPQTMEYFGQQYGFIAYNHVFEDPPKGPSILQVDIRDRALVLLDDDIIGVLTYTVINEAPLPSGIKSGTKLTLIVENEGRRNWRKLSDVTKGIVGNATIDGAKLEGWEAVSYELTPDDISSLETLKLSQTEFQEVKFPMFFTGEFSVPPPRNGHELLHPLDTFLDMKGWGKGVAWVNGHNLGRYWHVGSQQTLYLPGVWLKPHPAVNKITVLELHHANSSMKLKFITEPIFDYPPSSALRIPHLG